jgi:hypothetical protein
MAQSSIYRTEQASVVKVTLGSVVASDDEYGVVWQATSETLRILPIRRGMTSLSLSLENEVAFHLPVSLTGWGIVHNDLVAWSRARCHLVGEVDERCLLKILEARKAPASALATTLAADALAAPTRHRTRFF